LSEKQGIPADSRTCEWPDECFGPAIWFDSWPTTSLRVITLDPSKGNSEKCDYSAFVVLGVGPDNLFYVEADLARRDTSDIIEVGLQLAERFRPDAFLVEVNQFQELIRVELERKAAERNLALPLFGLTNTGNKTLRIRKLTPYLRRGRFRFKSFSPGTQLLVEQLRNFPGGTHDDGPDAMEMAVSLSNSLQAEEQMVREVVRA